MRGGFQFHFLALFLAGEEFPEELAEGVELPLVGDTAAVPLAVVQIIGVLVGRMGEEAQAQRSAPVQLDFDVYVAGDLVGGGAAFSCLLPTVPFTMTRLLNSCVLTATSKRFLPAWVVW